MSSADEMYDNGVSFGLSPKQPPTKTDYRDAETVLLDTIKAIRMFDPKDRARILGALAIFFDVDILENLKR